MAGKSVAYRLSKTALNALTRIISDELQGNISGCQIKLHRQEHLVQLHVSWLLQHWFDLPHGRQVTRGGCRHSYMAGYFARYIPFNIVITAVKLIRDLPITTLMFQQPELMFQQPEVPVENSSQTERKFLGECPMTYDPPKCCGCVFNQ